MNKNQKYYNPYPFPVRVLNDLANVYVMAPQDNCKILNGQYTQSVLNLPAVVKQPEYRSGLEVDLSNLKKQELIDLAWAVNVDGLDEKKTKKALVETIKEQVGED